MSTRLFVLTVMIGASLTTHAAPPAPVPLADVQLDTAKLKSWGERDYAMNYISDEDETPTARRVGSMTLACEVNEKSIKLDSRAKMVMPPDGKRFVKFQQACVYPATNLLSLSEITTNVARSDRVIMKDSRATVRGKELETIDKKGDVSKKTTSKWPENGILDLTVFYIVTIMPREPDRRYAIDHFITSTELEKSEPRIIECVGPDRTTGKDGKHWVKFLSYHPDKRRRAVQYWVSSDGVLRRAQLNKTNRMDLEVAEKKP